MYANVEEYVRAHGYELSDLTPAELKEVRAELDAINEGVVVDDGFFSPISSFTQRMLHK